ncbi:MAG: glycerophosphodiester phosphodiesterase [Thermoprotei archaeon]|nr:MAG: glycerophosphodiester phosphodiesterase [Thermoprotei archaeon]
MMVIGHRGMRFVEPENTIRAIERAINHGVDAVEVDVRMTKDRKLIIMHDETVDRTTNGKGRVRDLTLAQIKNLDAGKGETVPTLEEVLEIIKDKTKLILEIKEADTVKQVVGSVEKYGMWRDVIPISFYHTAILEVKKMKPNVEAGVIFVCEPLEPQELALWANASWIAPNLSYTTERLVSKAHGSGLKVNVWVVNTKEDVLKAKELGVDAITTDRADLITDMVKAGTLI